MQSAGDAVYLSDTGNVFIRDSIIEIEYPIHGNGLTIIDSPDARIVNSMIRGVINDYDTGDTQCLGTYRFVLTPVDC